MWNVGVLTFLTFPWLFLVGVPAFIGDRERGCPGFFTGFFKDVDVLAFLPWVF